MTLCFSKKLSWKSQIIFLFDCLIDFFLKKMPKDKFINILLWMFQHFDEYTSIHNMLKLWRQSYLFSCALNWSKFLCVVFSIGLPRSYGLISTILFFFKQNVFEDDKQICNLEKICKCLDGIHFLFYFEIILKKKLKL